MTPIVSARVCLVAVDLARIGCVLNLIRPAIQLDHDVSRTGGGERCPAR